MPKERSVVSSTALSSGVQKLGQPVPLSNLVLDENSGSVAAGAGEGAVAMLLEQRAGERPLGTFLAQYVVFRGRQQLVPLLVTMGDLVDRGGLHIMRLGHAAKREHRNSRGTGIKGLSACQHGCPSGSAKHAQLYLNSTL